ncbi:hypothetical protein NGM37_29190, partial [Streptomyces sp. TRM76130]|nr:hypothetical protein [Streptomyces sp. TRM76130]
MAPARAQIRARAGRPPTRPRTAGETRGRDDHRTRPAHPAGRGGHRCDGKPRSEPCDKPRSQPRSLQPP